MPLYCTHLHTAKHLTLIHKSIPLSACIYLKHCTTHGESTVQPTAHHLQSSTSPSVTKTPAKSTQLHQLSNSNSCPTTTLCKIQYSFWPARTKTATAPLPLLSTTPAHPALLDNHIYTSQYSISSPLPTTQSLKLRARHCCLSTARITLAQVHARAPNTQQNHILALLTLVIRRSYSMRFSFKRKHSNTF